MRLNHGSFYDTGDGVSGSNSLEEFTDSIQNHPRNIRNTKEILTTIENVHESLLKSNTENSITLRHDHASLSGKVSSKVENDTKGYRRVLKGADNKYEGDREHYLQEASSSEEDSYCNEVGVEEDNFTSSATFKSFASAVFFNSIFDDPSRGKTSNTNPLSTDGNRTFTDPLDFDKDWNDRHLNETGSSDSCFLMRFIKMRKRASAAFEEAARTASFRYKTTTSLEAEAICAFTNNDRFNIRERDELNDKGKLAEYVDTISTHSLQHVNLSLQTDPSEEDVKQFPSEYATDACWKLHDGFCPHVEALLPDSGSTDSRGYASCPWLEVLVSQIELSSSSSNHSFHTKNKIPLEECPGRESQEPTKIVEYVSRDDNDEIKNSEAQISIKKNESDILFSSSPKNYPFTKLRNRGSPSTRIIPSNVKFQRDQSMSGLLDSMDSFSPNGKTPLLSLDDVWRKESILGTVDDSKSNIEMFNGKEGFLSKVVGGGVKPKIPFLQDFESCNGDNSRSSKIDSASYEPLLSKFQFVKGQNFSNEDVTFRSKNEVTMNLHHDDELSSVRVPDSEKTSCELKDRRRNALGLTTSARIINSSYQMDNSMINFDTDYGFEQSKPIESFVSSRNNSNETCNCMESIETIFGRSSLQKPLSGNLPCTQHGFSAFDQSNPPYRLTESSDDKHDQCEGGNCFPLAQCEQTELIFGESGSSRTADLEYFVNIADEIQLNKEVGLDLESSSWMDALALRIQPVRSDETLLTNPRSLNLSSTDDGRSSHNDALDSDQYRKISQYQYRNLGVSNSRELVDRCSDYSHEISGSCPFKYNFCASRSFNEDLKTMGESSFDVSSRLDALNARIEEIFFNVDVALSKPRCSNDIQEGEGLEESKE